MSPVASSAASDPSTPGIGHEVKKPHAQDVDAPKAPEAIGFIAPFVVKKKTLALGALENIVVLRRISILTLSIIRPPGLWLPELLRISGHPPPKALELKILSLP